MRVKVDMLNEEVLNSLVEITIAEDDFLKIKETLTRIGIASKKDKKLYQSCHIFHKQGRYYITHFKEMFALDGKPTNITSEDIARRNKIVLLLEEWGLLKVLEVSIPKITEPIAYMSQIKIISFSEKNEYVLESKYSIGRIKNR
jgi:hypothetical protein